MNHPLLGLLKGYKPFDEIEALHVKQLRQFLKNGDNHYDKSNLVAHIVADAWIMNPAMDKVVLVEHALSKVWLAPGGHCDGNSDVLAAAIREAEEETGLKNLEIIGNGLYDINVGFVPTRNKAGNIEPGHIHFDVCFAFVTSENSPLQISDESTGLAWVDLSDIKNINYMQCHLRRVEKSLNRLKNTCKKV